MIPVKRVYNLKVIGGKPFGLQPDANPPLKHDGVKWIGQLLLSKDEYEELKVVVAEHGAELIHNEMITLEEHKEERERRHNMAQLDDTVFFAKECGTCSFCDLKEDGTGMICGVESWAPESVEKLLETDKAREDLTNCPLGKEP